jgi:hypothetical protein
MIVGQAASVTQFKQHPCSYLSPVSDHLVLPLGTIAAGNTSATVCMDGFLIQFAGATFDRVQRHGYVG